MLSEIVKADDSLNAELREMAALIKAMLPNGNKLTDQEALAGAMYGKAHGLSPFKGEFYIVPGKGIFPGYRGEVALRSDREFYTQFRPMNADEVAEHEIGSGDNAAVCELFQPDLMARMRSLGIPYRPIRGIGIVHKAEKWTAEEWQDTPNGRRKVKLDQPRRVDPPNGRSWAWKAEQRAYKDALRHMAGGADILDETVEDRLQNAEQRADTVTAEFRQLGAEEQQAKLAANVNAMRGPENFAGFGDDDLLPMTEADADFAAMPSASANVQTQPHWIDKQEVRSRFWAWATQHDLSKEDVHSVLGVTHVNEYTGTMGDAKARLAAYYQERIDAGIRAQQAGEV